MGCVPNVVSPRRSWAKLKGNLICRLGIRQGRFASFDFSGAKFEMIEVKALFSFEKFEHISANTGNW